MCLVLFLKEFQDIKLEDINIVYEGRIFVLEVKNVEEFSGILYEKCSTIIPEIINNQIQITINKEKHGMWPCLFKTEVENKNINRVYDNINKYNNYYL